jgi:hypothetical protein
MDQMQVILPDRIIAEMVPQQNASVRNNLGIVLFGGLAITHKVVFFIIKMRNLKLNDINQMIIMAQVITDRPETVTLFFLLTVLSHHL